MTLSICVCCCGSIPTSTSETLSLITRTASATSLMSDEVLPPLRISVHCLVGVQLDLHGRRAVPIRDLACPHLVITEDAARRMWAVMKRVGSGGSWRGPPRSLPPRSCVRTSSSPGASAPTWLTRGGIWPAALLSSSLVSPVSPRLPMPGL
jgi:hypothetical protein